VSNSGNYSGSPDQLFMINYRVENLEQLLKQLREEEVQIIDGIEENNYGKFAHILDIEGNLVELWEPNDEE
jgi:predicted enzyme related to lactoylglutathione lyase